MDSVSDTSGPSTTAATVSVPVSPGELLDKITILEIKRRRIADPAKRTNVMRELDLLCAVRDQAIPASGALDALVASLREINAKLWDIEDEIRRHERAGTFGRGFVMLARAVYHNNDQRAAAKRRINELLGATIVEEKSYADY